MPTIDWKVSVSEKNKAPIMHVMSTDAITLIGYATDIWILLSILIQRIVAIKYRMHAIQNLGLVQISNINFWLNAGLLCSTLEETSLKSICPITSTAEYPRISNRLIDLL